MGQGFPSWIFVQKPSEKCCHGTACCCLTLFCVTLVVCGVVSGHCCFLLLCHCLPQIQRECKYVQIPSLRTDYRLRIQPLSCILSALSKAIYPIGDFSFPSQWWAGLCKPLSFMLVFSTVFPSFARWDQTFHHFWSPVLCVEHDWMQDVVTKQFAWKNGCLLTQSAHHIS